MVALAYFALAALVFWPGLVTPADWVGTEARRVQIALEMLQRGDLLVPTLGGEPTLSKPPLHYWMLGAIARTLGTEPWMMRLPGAVAFAALACLAHGLLRRTYGAGAAWCAGLGTLLAPLAVVLVPRAEIDPLFAALTAGAILCLSYGAAFARRGWLVVGAVIAGAALLVKGPPFLMALAGTVAVWLRRRGGRGLLLAAVVMAIAPLSYYVVLVTTAVAPSALFDVAATESVGRLGSFTLAHVLDTPLHLLRAVAASLPFGLFLFFEYRGERRAEPDDAEAFLRMAAAGAFATVLILTVFPARPARYLLPAVPLFFAAVSPSVAAFARVTSLPASVPRVLDMLAVVAVAGLVATPWAPGPFGWRTTIGLVFVATLPLWVRSGRRTVAAMLMLPAVAAWTFVAPFAEFRATWREPFALSGRVLRRAIDAYGARDLATFLHVPSPLLLAAGVLPPGDELARREPRARWLLVEEDARPQEAWRHAAKVTGVPPDYVTRVRLQLPRVALLLLERP